MKILGVHTDFHDSGVSILVDGKPVVAVSEERYSRIKMDGAFPYLSLREALRLSGFTEKDFDVIAFSGSRPGLRKIYHFFRDQINRMLLTHGRHLSYGRLLRQFGITSAIDAFKIGQKVRALIRDFRAAGFAGKVVFVEHDQCHAAGVYFSSGYDDALVCIIEGSSFVNSASFWKGKDGNLRKVHEIKLPHSIGRYYELVTLILGFNPKKHGGKITGLAAFGDSSKLYGEVAKLLHIEGDRVEISPDVFIWYEQYLKHKELPAPFNGYSREDIAAAFQKRMEDVVTELIALLLKRYPSEAVLLSGGVASNVKLNMEIMHIPGVQHVSVHPGMSDVGQPFGAMLAAQKMFDSGFKPFRLEHVYLGTEFSKEQVREALKNQGMQYEEPDDYAARVANLLAQKKTVALFQGRMEFGPRALGNRSILYSAEDRTVNDWLNKRLNRTEFMPFAPVTLSEDVSECYNEEDIKISGDSVKFMTMTVRVTDFMEKRMSAAVHVDGTARPQVIDRATNPMYYDILNEYKKLTGLPTLVNTSFNMHEEPIICTPSEAITAYEQSKLDALAMPPYLVVREEA